MKFLNKLKYQKKIQPFDFLYYYVPVVILVLLGIADTLYLSISHYRVYADIGYKSFCAVSRAINCDTVSQSPYSIFLQIPLPIWGIIGYTFVLILLGLAGTKHANKKRLWGILFWILLIFSVHSVILAAISSFIIHSYCLMCIASYLINFALLYYFWFINRRFGDTGLIRGLVPDLKFLIDKKHFMLPICFVYLAVIISLLAAMPRYWELDPPKLSQSINKGITSDGHPWIGADDPELVIVEYTDYLCFQCRKFHFYLRELIQDNPEKIRLVHRHFPLDHKFNPIVRKKFHGGSGKLALFTIYAQAQGKFWEANDLFFKLNPKIKIVKLKPLAESLGLNYKDMSRAQYDAQIQSKLLKDIRAGLELGISGTPAYVIKNELYQGHIPPRILKKALQ